MSDDDAVVKTVAPKHLIALVREIDNEKTRVQSIVGTIGERVKEAVENGHLHKGAFNLLSKLYRMDDLKRRDYIDSVRLYLDIAEEQHLFGDEHVGDLAKQADEAAALAKEESAKASRANAKKLAEGIKQLPESDRAGTYSVQ